MSFSQLIALFTLVFPFAYSKKENVLLSSVRVQRALQDYNRAMQEQAKKEKKEELKKLVPPYSPPTEAHMSELGSVNIWEDGKKDPLDKDLPIRGSVSEEDYWNARIRKFLTNRDRIPYDVQGLLSRNLLQYFGIHNDHAVGLCQRKNDRRFIHTLRWNTTRDPQRGLYANPIPLPELVGLMINECAQQGGELTALHIAE